MALKTEVVTFRTGPQMKAAIELLAANREMTSGELARHVLSDFVVRHAIEVEAAATTNQEKVEA